MVLNSACAYGCLRNGHRHLIDLANLHLESDEVVVPFKRRVLKSQSR